MWALKRNTFLIALTIATACLLVGVFLLAPSSVEAQSDPIADQINNTVPLNSLDPLTDDQINAIVKQNTPADTGQTVNPAYEVQFTTVAKWVYDALVAVGGWINWLGGWLLDVSLSWFVIHMVETTKSFGLDTVVKTVWALFRDLFNLLFIFGLILVGFKLILGVDDSGSKRTLGTIVIAALLINFSLYAAQVVVDLGNILSVEMSKQIQPAKQHQIMGQTVFNFSDAFVSVAHLDNIGSSTLPFAAQLTTGNKEDIPHDKIDVGGALVIGLSVAAMLIVVGFVFAAGAFLMFLRYFYLIFLMMLSPIMVLGLVLPQFRSQGHKWWSTLFKQALIGPAYLMMLYIALLALRTFANVQSTDITTFILMSLIVSGFAWASLIVAKNIGAMGATGMMSLGQGLARNIRGGATGFAGRNTLGRFGDWYNKRLEERGVSDKSQLRRLASSLAGNKFGSSLSRTSARESQEKADQKGARHQQLQKAQTTIVAGHNAPAGAAGDDARIKMERAVTGLSNEQAIEMLGKHKAGSPEYERIIEHMSASQFEAIMKAKPEELDDKAKEAIADKRKTYVQSAVTTSGGISKASDAQLKILGAEQIANNADLLKQSQFDDIMKSKDYTETEKKKIRDQREDKLKTAFNADPAVFLNSRKDKEVAKLPDKILTNPLAAPHLTAAQLKQILHEDTLTKVDRTTVRTNISTSGSTATKNWLKTTEGRLF